MGHPSPAILTLIVFGNGICAGLGFPAFQAILPDLVPVEDLPSAMIGCFAHDDTVCRELLRHAAARGT